MMFRIMLTKELKDANVSIKVESNGNKVEINTSSDKKDQEKKLEDLEGGRHYRNVIHQKQDSIKKQVIVKKKK